MHPRLDGPWNLIGTIRRPQRPFLLEEWLPRIGRTFEFSYADTTAKEGDDLGQNRWMIHEKHHPELTVQQIGRRFPEEEIEFVGWEESKGFSFFQAREPS